MALPTPNQYDKLKFDLRHLEKRIKKLEGEGKDVWDVLSIIGSVLVPVAIAFTGLLFTYQQNIASERMALKEQESEERFNQANTEIATIQARVEQSQAMSNLIEALSSNDGPKRRLAVVAVELALRPEDAKKVLEIIASQDTDPQVVAAAENSLENVNVVIETTADSERAGFQALLDGDLIKARQSFGDAYDASPTLRNVDEIYNLVLTPTQVQTYNDASAAEQATILQRLYGRILADYARSMPDDLRTAMESRIVDDAAQ
ncbi:MAG: hypothetical protein AAGF98_07555 [Cyanobacteria bacterium P01_H01_bin.153]